MCSSAYSPVISLEEYTKSVQKLREWSLAVESGTTTDPVHYRSGIRVRLLSLFSEERTGLSAALLLSGSTLCQSLNVQ